MKKIISLFQRNYDGDRLVRDEVVPGAEWVIAGEGHATIKHDGTCCMVRNGQLYKRYDAKNGKQPPAGFEPAQEPDPVTGHWPGWLPIRADDPQDRWACEAIAPHAPTACGLRDGTYELVGPKIGNKGSGNPYGLAAHQLWLHGGEAAHDVPRTFDALRSWFVAHAVEGIVWWHPDGRMVKIKRRDFGLPWPVAQAAPR